MIPNDTIAEMIMRETTKASYNLFHICSLLSPFLRENLEHVEGKKQKTMGIKATLNGTFRNGNFYGLHVIE